MKQVDRDLRDLFEADARSVELVRVRRRASVRGWFKPVLAAGVAVAIALAAGTQLAELREPDPQAGQPAQPTLLSDRPTCDATRSQDHILATFEVGEGVAKICRPEVTKDGGASWTALRIDWLGQRGPAGEGVISIGADPRTRALFLGTSYGRILRALPPYSEWMVVHDPGEAAFQASVQGFVFGDRLFAASFGLLMSTDGLAWTDVTTNLGSFGTSGRGRLVPVGPAISSNGVLLGVAGNRPEVGIWETTDEGRTWTQLFGEGQPIALSASGDVVAVAVSRDADSPASWVSEDAGRTWIPVDFTTDVAQSGSILRAIEVTDAGVYAGSPVGLLELSSGREWMILLEAKDVRAISDTSDGLLVASATGLWLLPTAP